MRIFAGEGVVPELVVESDEFGRGVVAHRANVELEGVVVRGTEFVAEDAEYLEEEAILFALERSEFIATDCRFESETEAPCIRGEESTIELERCQIIVPASTAVVLQPGRQSRLRIADSLVLSEIMLTVESVPPQEIELERNTFFGGSVLMLAIEADEAEPLVIRATGNVFDALQACLLIVDLPIRVAPRPPSSVDGRIERLFGQATHCRG